MTRFLWSLGLSVWTVACTTGPGGGSQTPLQDACTQKVQDNAAVISKKAAELGEPESQLSSEVVSACVAQLQHDLDELIPDLEGTSNDAGTTVTVQKDAQ